MRMLQFLKHRRGLGSINLMGQEYVEDIFRERGANVNPIEQQHYSHFGRKMKPGVEFPARVWYNEPTYVSQLRKARLPRLEMNGNGGDPFQYRDYSGLTVQAAKDWDSMTETVTATDGMYTMAVFAAALSGIILLGG